MHSAVRLGLVKNAAGSSPVSALSARSMLVTAGNAAIEAGTVPTKRFCRNALHRHAVAHALRIGSMLTAASLAHSTAAATPHALLPTSGNHERGGYIVPSSARPPTASTVPPSLFADRSLRRTCAHDGYYGVTTGYKRCFLVDRCL